MILHYTSRASYILLDNADRHFVCQLKMVLKLRRAFLTLTTLVGLSLILLANVEWDSYESFVRGFNWRLSRYKAVPLFWRNVKIGQVEKNDKLFRVCRFSPVGPSHPIIRRLVRNTSSAHLGCVNNSRLFYAENRFLKSNESMLKKFGKKFGKYECSYTPFGRENEWRLKFGKRSVLSELDEVELHDEFLRIDCYSPEKLLYRDLVANIALKTRVDDRCVKALKNSEHLERLSVLLIGLDSVSKVQYLSHLPSTDSYIRRKMSLVEFHGYNVLGRTKLANVIPLLTGKFLPEFETRMKDTPVDFLPFAWKIFAEKGYTTLMAEEIPVVSGYGAWKTGFVQQPTDYYFRPFSIAFEKSKFKKQFHKNSCKGDKALVSPIILKWVEDAFNEFSGDPVFAYVYLANRGNATVYLDEMLLNLLQKLRSGGHIDNSLIFFFSDYGLGGTPSAVNVERPEEKLPFFFLLLPSWFSDEFPAFYKSLKLNEKRLVTAFDIHATLMDVATFMLNVRTRSNLSRSVSLFTPISINRTCRIANVNSFYCIC